MPIIQECRAPGNMGLGLMDGENLYQKGKFSMQCELCLLGL